MFGPHAPLALNFLCDVNFWDLAKSSDPVTLGVMGTLGFASLLSWTIILGKLFSLRRARASNRKFLRAFRKAPRLDAVAAASEQYRTSPLVGVFDFGYSEVCRQMADHKRVANQVALERTLQVGISEEVTRMERNMNWLATCAAVCPFIGLFGTVLGIIDAFNQLGLSGSTSMRAVGPGIARALLATAMGLAAAIPAAIFYNYFGNAIKEIAARLEDFALEFLNLTERNLEN
ncbi:MAG TPA: MotA/TolQ/ExbB proton channel family protein [Bryobacteraceae bacterium]|jgi:biopolymer transport protein TolQ